MPYTYELTDFMKSEIYEALDRMMSKRELASVLSTHQFNNQSVKATTEDDKEKIEWGERKYANDLAYRHDKDVLVRSVLQIMGQHCFCTKDAKVLYLDDLGKHTICLETFKMIKAGDSLREVDWMLCNSNVAISAQNLDGQLGMRLEKITNPKNFGYTLSDKKAKLCFTINKQGKYEVKLEGANRHQRTLWEKGVDQIVGLNDLNFSSRIDKQKELEAPDMSI